MQGWGGGVAISSWAWPVELGPSDDHSQQSEHEHRHWQAEKRLEQDLADCEVAGKQGHRVGWSGAFSGMWGCFGSACVRGWGVR